MYLCPLCLIAHLGRPPTGSAVNRPITRSGAGIPANGSVGSLQSTASLGAVPKTAALRNQGIDGQADPSLQRLIAERPFTQQGLGNSLRPLTVYTSHGGGLNRLPTAASPTRRVVQDKSYFVGELSQKIALLKSEIARLSDENATIDRERANDVAFEQKAEVLRVALCEQQNHLGDLNLLIEKLHVGATLQSIDKESTAVEKQTEELRVQQAQTLKTRQLLESELSSLEKDIQPYLTRLEAQIDDVPSAKQRELVALEASAAQLDVQLKQRHAKYEELSAKSDKIRRFLDQFPAQYEQLKSDCAQLKLQLDGVEVTGVGVSDTTGSGALFAGESLASLDALQGDSNNSPEDMARELLRAREQIGSLTAQQRKGSERVAQLERELQETLAHIDFISNAPAAKKELERAKVELKAQVEALKPLTERLRGYNAELDEQIREKQKILEKSETFNRIEGLQKKLALYNEKSLNLKRGKVVAPHHLNLQVKQGVTQFQNFLRCSKLHPRLIAIPKFQFANDLYPIYNRNPFCQRFLAQDLMITKSNYLPLKQQLLELANQCSEQQQKLLRQSSLKEYAAETKI